MEKYETLGRVRGPTVQPFCEREPMPETSNLILVEGYPIPRLIAGGLARYILQHIRPGSGLQAILEGDLFEAFNRCDPFTVLSLDSIVRVIVNCAPAACWGSADFVQDWISVSTIGGSGATKDIWESLLQA